MKTILLFTAPALSLCERLCGLTGRKPEAATGILKTTKRSVLISALIISRKMDKDH